MGEGMGADLAVPQVHFRIAGAGTAYRDLGRECMCRSGTGNFMTLLMHSFLDWNEACGDP